MKIALFAGLQTSKITEVISKRVNFGIYHNSDLELGLAEVVLNLEVDKIVLFDAALVKNEKIMDCVEVFRELYKLAKSEPDREIVFISKTQKFMETFEQIMYDCGNARKVEITNLNSRLIISAILGKEVVKEVVPQVEFVPQVEVQQVKVEEPKPLPVKDTGGFVQGVEEPEPEPIIEAIEKPKKKMKIMQKREELSDLFSGNKLIVVTGNPNSGATNLACELANTLKNNRVDTMLIDMDVYSKGVNMYFDDLDNDNSNGLTRAGLSQSLKDLTTIDDGVQEVDAMLDMLGTSSDYSVDIFEYNHLDKELVFDVVSTFTIDYRITLVHILPEQIMLYRDLLKVADRIVYATNPTINGLQTIKRILTTSGYKDDMDKRYLTLLHRKLRYVLTNYGNNKRINHDNFIDCLADITKEHTLLQNVVGVVKHKKDFDEFTTTKKLYSSGQEKDNFYEIFKNIIR